MMEKTAEFYKISCSVILGFLANLYDKYSVMLVIYYINKKNTLKQSLRVFFLFCFYFINSTFSFNYSSKFSFIISYAIKSYMSTIIFSYKLIFKG